MLYSTQTFYKKQKILFKMFSKLVVLFALSACAFAGVVHHEYKDVVSHVPSVQYRNYYDTETEIVEKPVVNQVGSIVKSYPSATSYQSQTQYHSKSVVEPIYAHGVEKKVISTPITKTVVEEVAVPVQKTVVTAPVHHVEYAHAAPVVQYSAPIVKAAYPAAYPAYTQYAHAPSVYSHAAPLTYAHSYAAPAYHQW